MESRGVVAQDDDIEAIDLFAEKNPRTRNSERDYPVDATDNHPLIQQTILNNIRVALDPTADIPARIESITSSLAVQPVFLELNGPDPAPAILVDRPRNRCC